MLIAKPSLFKNICPIIKDYSPLLFLFLSEKTIPSPPQ